VRRIILASVLVLAATACAADHVALPAVPAGLEVRSTGSPLVRVTDGAVSALVPDRWAAAPVALDAASNGFIASPHPELWHQGGVLEPGLSASWVDATRVGVPSDVYYLVATGPLFTRLESPGCRQMRGEVFSDNAPDFVGGPMSSPGDYVATSEGVCTVPGTPARRWSYFVAAPGFGASRTVGIPASGLYVAIAVTTDSPGAHQRLTSLLSSVRFGGAGVADFLEAARAPGPGA
jgi:hypothetical protein